MAEETRNLQIVLQARDEASRVIKGVADQAGHLGTTIKDTLKNNVIALGGAFAATTGVIVTSIAAFSESENVTTQLNAAIKATGGAAGVTSEEVLKLSASLQQQSKFSDEAITSAQTLLIQYGDVGKEVFPEATKAILDLAQGMNIDLRSAAQAVGLALSAPTEALGRLRRQGIIFKADVEEQIKTLASSGKQMEAQKIILDALSGSFGGSALAASQTFSGQMAILKNNINDLQETIGKGLLVALDNLTGGFGGANQAIINLNNFLKEHNDILLGLVVSLGVVAATFGVLFVAALIAVAGTAGIVIVAIGGLVAAVAFLATVIAVNFAAISAVVNDMKTGFILAFQEMLTSVTGTISFVQETLMLALQSIGQFFMDAFTVNIPFAVGFAIGFLTTAIPAVVSDIISWLSALPAQVLAIFQLVVSSIVERITFVANWLKVELSAWPARIQGFIASIPTIVATIFESAKSFVITKMREMFEGVEFWWNKIKGILEAIKSAAEAAISAVTRGIEAGRRVGASFQFGGFVPTTGLALLHAGEFVISKDMMAGRAPIPSAVQNTTFNQPISINASIQAEPDWDALSYKLAWILRNSR